MCIFIGTNIRINTEIKVDRDNDMDNDVIRATSL